MPTTRTTSRTCSPRPRWSTTTSDAAASCSGRPRWGAPERHRLPAVTPQTPMKARLAAGETLFGTFLTLGSPLAAESLALAGFDWLLVDLEHGGGDESLLLGQLLGATAGGAHALVRV